MTKVLFLDYYKEGFLTLQQALTFYFMKTKKDLPMIYIKRLPLGEHKIYTTEQLPVVLPLLVLMTYILPFVMTIKDIAVEKESRLKVQKVQLNKKNYSLDIGFNEDNGIS